MATWGRPLARQMRHIVFTKHLQARFLRTENPIFLTGRHLPFKSDLDDELRIAGIAVAHISREFRDFHKKHWTYDCGRDVLNVATVRRHMSDDRLAAFAYWAGIHISAFLTSVAIQGNGGTGELLTNGVLNGAVSHENPEFAMTARWHDPTRPYDEQTATFPELGWSFNVVSTASRRWCPQGGKILYKTNGQQ